MVRLTNLCIVFLILVIRQHDRRCTTTMRTGSKAEGDEQKDGTGGEATKDGAKGEAQSGEEGEQDAAKTEFGDGENANDEWKGRGGKRRNGRPAKVDAERFLSTVMNHPAGPHAPPALLFLPAQCDAIIAHPRASVPSYDLYACRVKPSSCQVKIVTAVALISPLD